MKILTLRFFLMNRGLNHVKSPLKSTEGNTPGPRCSRWASRDAQCPAPLFWPPKARSPGPLWVVKKCEKPWKSWKGLEKNPWKNDEKRWLTCLTTKQNCWMECCFKKMVWLLSVDFMAWMSPVLLISSSSWWRFLGLIGDCNKNSAPLAKESLRQVETT